jgi:hypothetical protein
MSHDLYCLAYCSLFASVFLLPDLGVVGVQPAIRLAVGSLLFRLFKPDHDYSGLKEIGGQFSVEIRPNFGEGGEAVGFWIVDGDFVGLEGAELFEEIIKIDMSIFNDDIDIKQTGLLRLLFFKDEGSLIFIESSEVTQLQHCLLSFFLDIHSK